MPDGKEIFGEIQAESREAAEEKLSLSGLKITRLKSSFMGNWATLALSKEKISKKQLSVFSSQLFLCLSSGLPLLSCLKLIGTESKMRVVKKMILSAERGISEGKTFAKVLEDGVVSVPKPYIAAIDAGEKSGALADTVKAMSEYYERESKISSKFFTALIYPIMLLLLCLAIMIGTWKVIIPTVQEISFQNGSDIPPTTSNYIAVMDFLEHNFIFILSGIVLLVLFVLLLLRNKKIHFILSKSVLMLPFVGSIIKAQNTAKFSEISKTLLDVGIPLADALDSSCEIISNYAMRENVKEARKRILSGGSFLSVLEKERVFPDVFIGMVSAGEASDTLYHSLKSASEYYKSEAEMNLKRFSSIAEPVMIVIVGIVVALVMVSVYSMLMEMYGSF